MAAISKQLRVLEGERVRIRFLDGREEVVRLLCATRDMDGSEHLVYERIGPGSVHFGPCLYSDAKSILGVEPIDTEAAVA